MATTVHIGVSLKKRWEKIMTRMLVLSNKLLRAGEILEPFSEVKADYCPWEAFPNVPRVSDYEIVVLDMNISKPESCNGAFFGLRDEIATLLSAGGVIICLNYFTVYTGKKLPFNPKNSPLRENDIYLIDNYTRLETNYDWLFSEKLLSRLNIAQTDAKLGKYFVLISKAKAYAEYFDKVTEYHKIIENVTEKRDYANNLLGYQFRLDYENNFDTEIVAVSKVTQQPVACKIKFGNGSLVLLPQSKAGIATVVEQLYAIGSGEYANNTKNVLKLLKAPSWVSKYKTLQELTLDQKREKLESEICEIELAHKKFDKIDVLLYGTGEALENAVAEALADIGCSVEKLEKGATMDYKVRSGKMKFVIEVTGVEDKIYKDNKHFSQILQFLPQKEADEKIVFLVNTYKDLDIEERKNKENFTKPVLEIGRNNHFVLMTTSDLYLMWRDFNNGEPAEKLLTRVFQAEEEFRYVPKKA